MSLTKNEQIALEYAWWFWAREEQLPPPGHWMTWLFMAGRGAGKTRAAVEWVHDKAEAYPGARIAIVGRTAKDVREIMAEGQSGIMARARPWCAPKYQPGLARIVWPNGTIGLLHSAQEPNSFRGHQQHFYWADEMAAWEYSESYTQLKLGLRLGAHPQGIVTTTPRPVKHIIDLIARKTTVVTRGTTYDNLGNLAPTFREQILNEYEGTTIGRQELLGELLTGDMPGALVKRSAFEHVDVIPKMLRIVVGVDPAVSDAEDACHTGIVVAGFGVDKLFYVLEDASKHAHVTEWARIVVSMYHKWQADFIVGEANNGGDLIEALIKAVDPTVAYRKVHASRGKRTRAEPIAMLYEQGRIKHYAPGFPHLEDELCSYDPLQSAKSPDRLDAAVWALSHLKEHKPAPNLKNIAGASPKRIEPFRNV